MGRVGAGNLQLSNGFNSVLPLEHLAEFDASELELLLCGKPQHRRHCTNAPIHCWQARLSLGDCGARAGLPSIDMRDWQSNAEYRSGYTADHPVIQRFWQVVEAMGDDGRAKLLRFVTGTSALPAVTLNPPGFWVTLKSKRFAHARAAQGGFSDLQGSEGIQRFCIIRVAWGEERLPQVRGPAHTMPCRRTPDASGAHAGPARACS